MKQILLICMLFVGFNAYATVGGKVKTKSGEAIQGASIYWLNGKEGVVTNEKGEFSISENDNSNKLVISIVGFKSDTLEINEKYTIITLKESVQLNELAVLGINNGKIKLRTVMFNTEKINAAELCKAACCNLSESFETNPSVDVSYSDAATGAKQIKLLGLPGTYVQMLTENIPNLRGISAPYGMSFIPGPWMESIQVSKGTSSVVNGYEAVTGQINVEYKKPPTSEKVAFNIFGSDAGRVEANLNASALLSKKLSTGILLHASDEFMSLDDNGDNFIDMPMVKQYNFINRWYYKSDHFVSQAFVRALSEKRHGGQVNGDYKIGVESERVEFFVKNGLTLNKENNTNIALILSGSTHNQHSLYGPKHYKGMQNSLYSNLIFQTQWTEAHKLTSGLNVNYDAYNEVLTDITIQPYLKNELVLGLYSEYISHLDE
jgi:hypothetical protein